MRNATTRAGLALALAVLASPLTAQQGPPTGGQPQLPDSIRTMVQEFQTLRAHLGEVQSEAMEANPDLQDQQAAVQAFLEEKMLETQPGLEGDMVRLDTLRAQAERAQAEGDTGRLQEIMREGTRLRSSLAEAQTTAMQREDVQARVESFEDDMMTAMEEIDADIEDAIDRMEDLAGRLQAFQAGG